MFRTWGGGESRSIARALRCSHCTARGRKSLPASAFVSRPCFVKTHRRKSLRRRNSARDPRNSIRTFAGPVPPSAPEIWQTQGLPTSGRRAFACKGACAWWSTTLSVLVFVPSPRGCLSPGCSGQRVCSQDATPDSQTSPSSVLRSTMLASKVCSWSRHGRR